MQNVNKDYVIFLYFCNFFAKRDPKPKTKNGMNKSQAFKNFDEIFDVIIDDPCFT